MKKLILLISLLVAFLVLFPLPVKADGSITGITITKTVLNPTNDSYVKTLTINDALYHPDDTVVFHLMIMNNSSQNLEQVIVKDNLPSYLSFISGPGSYDQKNNTLSFLAYNLKPGTSQSFSINTKVVSSNQFPQDKQEICLSNMASILFGQNQSAQDEAQFCIQNKVVQTSTTKGGQSVFPPSTVKTTPSTGTESIFLPILISLACLGIWIIRNTKSLVV